MNHPPSRRVFLSALGSLPLVAADFWQDKKFIHWSDKEVGKILNDSPWAKSISAPMEGMGGGGMGGGGGRGRGGGGGGGRGGGMGGGGGLPEAGGGVEPGGGGLGGGAGEGGFGG